MSAGSYVTNNSTASRSGGTASFSYQADHTFVTEAIITPLNYQDNPLLVGLLNTVSEKCVPDSLILSLGGKTYIDRNGVLYADLGQGTGSGTASGEINYDSGILSLTRWTDGATLNMSVIAGLTSYGDLVMNQIYLRTAGSPLRPSSTYVQVTAEDGTLLTGTADDSGEITGTNVRGTVNVATGVIRCIFGSMVLKAGNEGEAWYDATNVVGAYVWKPIDVIASTFRYSAVVQVALPLNADILGLDPVRLPQDGRVPIYRPADVVVIHNTSDFSIPDNPPLASTEYSVGRGSLVDLWLVDSLGVKVSDVNFTVDLDLGKVLIAASPSWTGYTGPYKARHRVEDMALVTDVQITGQLSLSSPLTRNYPLDTYVSSALLFGDMRADVTNMHDLASWSAWSDTATGSGATAQYNNIDFPVEVLNEGAVRERWRINFTSPTAFQVIGENLGVIATGTTSADCEPVNALTGKKYFTLRAGGWGSGWATGNQVRFNTVPASSPIWMARTILAGATLAGDSFSAQMRGDVDLEA